MNLLPVEPTIDAATVTELRALATAVSRQAAGLYEDLAGRMAEYGRTDAADVFHDLSRDERDAATPGTPWAGRLPEALTDEGQGNSRLVTRYTAYSLAVRNAERLFALWTYAGAHTDDPAVQAEAERLARASDARAHALRAKRRQAFHRERQSAARLDLLDVRSLGEFKRLAGEREAGLAALHHRLADTLAQAGDGRATAVARIAQEEADNSRRLGAEPRGTEAPGDPPPPEIAAQLALSLERLEAAAEAYLAAAEGARDETVMTLAQELADRAIARLAALG